MSVPGHEIVICVAAFQRKLTCDSSPQGAYRLLEYITLKFKLCKMQLFLHNREFHVNKFNQSGILENNIYLHWPLFPN